MVLAFGIGQIGWLAAHHTYFVKNHLQQFGVMCVAAYTNKVFPIDSQFDADGHGELYTRAPLHRHRSM
jgi:hypothetical protein